MAKILFLIAAVGCAWGQTPTIDEIMRRVAVNQAKSEELRTQFVYHQSQVLKMMRSNKKVAREEHREYTVTPKFRGGKRELVKFDGKYENHGQFFAYDKPNYQYKGTDIDGQILDGMANDMLHDGNSKDGVANDLFPLTYHRQLKYDFKLVGEERYKGRKVYRVKFEPKKKPGLGDFDDGAIWKGHALVDAEEFQPVMVATDLAVKAPLLVKTLLGTNFHGIGFSVSYEKFADGVWFPVSYGGEFQIRAVFFYARTITIAMKNSDFRRADVQSNIAYATEEKTEKIDK